MYHLLNTAELTTLLSDETFKNSKVKEATIALLHKQEKRLTWLSMHNDYDFNRDSSGGYMSAYLSSYDKVKVSGTYMVRGESFTECVDKFIAGETLKL